MKILIGCPTQERYEYCIDLWVKAVKDIIDFSKGIQIDYLLVDNSESDDFFNEAKLKGIEITRVPYSNLVRERIVNSRNLLREKAIKEGYDYFFSLEQDIIPKKDIIKKLLADKKDIISAYYGKIVNIVAQDTETGEIKDFKIELPVIWLNADDKVRQANPNEILNREVIGVGAFGLGCVLIHRKVLEKIKFRFEKGKDTFDDMFFCGDAAAAGWNLFLDSDMRVEHLEKPWDDELQNQK